MSKISEAKINANCDNVTFGCEIECYMPNSWLQSNNIRIGGHGNGHNLPGSTGFNRWEAEQDGSLDYLRNRGGGINYDYTAVEFVSPVLLGNTGLEEVFKFMTFLKEGGMKVSNKCGFHVHIGVNSVMGLSHQNDFNMVASWIARLLHMVSRHEGALFAIGGNPDRMNSTYCRTVKTSYHQSTKFDDSWSQLHGKLSGLPDSRYRVVNLQNVFSPYGSKRTVEFRCFAATITPRKAVGYIIAALSIAVKSARRGNAVKFNSNATTMVDAPRQVELLINETRGAGRVTGAESYYRGAFASWRFCANQIVGGNQGESL